MVKPVMGCDDPIFQANFPQFKTFFGQFFWQNHSMVFVVLVWSRPDHLFLQKVASIRAIRAPIFAKAHLFLHKLSRIFANTHLFLQKRTYVYKTCQGFLQTYAYFCESAPTFAKRGTDFCKAASIFANAHLFVQKCHTKMLRTVSNLFKTVSNSLKSL